MYDMNEHSYVTVYASRYDVSQSMRTEGRQNWIREANFESSEVWSTSCMLNKLIYIINSQFLCRKYSKTSDDSIFVYWRDVHGDNYWVTGNIIGTENIFK